VENAVLVLSGNSSHLWDNSVQQRWRGTALKIAAAAIGRHGAEWSELCCQSWEHNSNPPADEHSRNSRGLSASRGDVLCASLLCAVAALPSYRSKEKNDKLLWSGCSSRE